MTENRNITVSKNKGFYKELYSLAIPIALQNLLLALIGASDALMLGRLSQDAVSAVSLANQISFIMNLFIGALIGGAGVLVAQYWGKGDRRMVTNLLCLTIKIGFCISFVFFLLSFFCPEMLMSIFTTDKALIDIGASYLKIVSFSYLFVGITQCYYMVMRVEGKATKCVTISIVTVVADMVIDLFLIYGIAGAPRLGADGSAYSTIAVEAIGMIWCMVESYRRVKIHRDRPQENDVEDSSVQIDSVVVESIHPDREGMRWFSTAHIKDLLKIATPMLASALAWGLSISMHSLIMGHLGNDATAASSITYVAQELITCLARGVSAGAGIMVGKVLGQNMFDKAKEYGRLFAHISFAVGAISTGILGIVGPIVVVFFVLSEAAKGYLIAMLIFSAIYLFAYAFNTVIVVGVFPAGGDAKYDAVSVLIASWCFAIPLALLGTFLFHWPVLVVYFIMCADEIVKVPWVYPRYKKYYWLRNMTRNEA